jgi:amino acid transporter
MAGWNFFIYEALLIPFEITALTLVLGFWSDNIPGWAIPVACIVSPSTHVRPRLSSC